jgi:uncharacterized protein (TIGR00251 family)
MRSTQVPVSLIPLRESSQGLSFSIRVQPRAKRNAVVGVVGEALKISLTAPPFEGRANEALIEFLSGLLSVPRAAITVLSGEQSRNKIVRISGITRSELLTRLQAEISVLKPVQ